MAKAPYYESRFIRANAPDAPRAVWLRETLLLPAAGEESGLYCHECGSGGVCYVSRGGAVWAHG
ncbi:MAG: hypothetical protein WA944_12080 [Mycobacterium sp.]